MCQIRVTARFAPSGNFGASFARAKSPPIRARWTVGPQCSLVAPAYAVLPSRGSSITWYTGVPSKYGPILDHLPRSGEWNRNAPFFVPTRTAVLPFFTVFAKSTTCDAGEDVDDVPRMEASRLEVPAHEVLVHEHVDVPPRLARLVDDAIPDAGERRIEAPEEGGDVERLEQDLVQTVRVLAERMRDPDEDPGAHELVRGTASLGHPTPPRKREGDPKGLCRRGRP